MSLSQTAQKTNVLHLEKKNKGSGSLGGVICCKRLI